MTKYPVLGTKIVVNVLRLKVQPEQDENTIPIEDTPIFACFFEDTEYVYGRTSLSLPLSDPLSPSSPLSIVV